MVIPYVPIGWVTEGLSNDKSSVVCVMAWCQSGAKPLPEPLMKNFLCVTRDHGINSLVHWWFDYSLKLVNFNVISMINIFSIFCEIATR